MDGQSLAQARLTHQKSHINGTIHAIANNVRDNLSDILDLVN
jgi:hypothetical protein